MAWRGDDAPTWASIATHRVFRASQPSNSLCFPASLAAPPAAPAALAAPAPPAAQRRSLRASSASLTCPQCARRAATACRHAHRLATVDNRVAGGECCASAHPSAAERRLMVTPICCQKRQKCTNPCPSRRVQRKLPAPKRCAFENGARWHLLSRNWVHRWAASRNSVLYPLSAAVRMGRLPLAVRAATRARLRTHSVSCSAVKDEVRACFCTSRALC